MCVIEKKRAEWEYTYVYASYGVTFLYCQHFSMSVASKLHVLLVPPTVWPARPKHDWFEGVALISRPVWVLVDFAARGRFGAHLDRVV